MIQNYDDFIKELNIAGFSMGSGNAEEIYTVIPCDWNQEHLYDTKIKWHTGEPDTDPWEWRIRVLKERHGIAYAKLFFKKSGYITLEWYPYFLSARRGDYTFDEAYEDGLLSHNAKRIYDVFQEYKTINAYEIKQLAKFFKEDKTAFDRALTELQMKMYITICGQHQEISPQTGEPYGWPTTVFCTVEEFWGKKMLEKASEIDYFDAVEKIKGRILALNPGADEKRIKKFILG